MFMPQGKYQDAINIKFCFEDSFNILHNVVSCFVAEL